jgi:hypothetical protein
MSMDLKLVGSSSAGNEKTFVMVIESPEDLCAFNKAVCVAVGMMAAKRKISNFAVCASLKEKKVLMIFTSDNPLEIMVTLVAQWTHCYDGKVLSLTPFVSTYTCLLQLDRSSLVATMGENPTNTCWQDTVVRVFLEDTPPTHNLEDYDVVITTVEGAVPLSAGQINRVCAALFSPGVRNYKMHVLLEDEPFQVYPTLIRDEAELHTVLFGTTQART